MTDTDITALVGRLRSEIRDRDGNAEFYDPDVTDMLKEVADVLEAMQVRTTRAEAAAEDAVIAYNEVEDRAEKAEEEIERLREALVEIDQWGKAYPLNVFPEPDLKKARALLEAGGMTLDAISASNMRHVVEGVAKIACSALAGDKL